MKSRHTFEPRLRWPSIHGEREQGMYCVATSHLAAVFLEETKPFLIFAKFGAVPVEMGHVFESVMIRETGGFND